MNRIRLILQAKLQLSDWAISKPKDGQQKEAYIAHSGSQSVFIKFDVPILLLQRLGEIEVAPRVVASGEEHGRSYVVQEYSLLKKSNAHSASILLISWIFLRSTSSQGHRDLTFRNAFRNVFETGVW